MPCHMFLGLRPHFLTCGITHPVSSLEIRSIFSNYHRTLHSKSCLPRGGCWHFVLDGDIQDAFSPSLLLQPRTNQKRAEGKRFHSSPQCRAPTLTQNRTAYVIYTIKYLFRAVLDREVTVVRNSPVSTTAPTRCRRGRPRLRYFPPGYKEVFCWIGVAAAHAPNTFAQNRQRRRGGTS